VVNSELTAQFAVEIGLAIGTYVNKEVVCIGTDTRTSAEMLKQAVASGILATGCKVIDLGVLPTPALQYAVQFYNAAHGVVITASHNPPQFNGIKCIAPDGIELPRAEEEKIEQIYFNKAFKVAKWYEVHNITSKDIIQQYINAICNLVNADEIKSAQLTIVVDCGNGTGSLVTPYVLEKLGCKVITLNAQPDGMFPGHPSEPTKENIMDLCNCVKNLDADLGIVHDGDADRTIFVSEDGMYVEGDKTLALAAEWMTKKHGGGIVVTPVATSSCVEDVVVKNKGRVKYTKVGSPTVARTMKSISAIFGGEENGGLIFPEHQYCRDGPMAAAKIIELVATERKKLSELVDALPAYTLCKTKVSCPDEKKNTVLQKLLAKVDAEGLKKDLTDGVKIFLQRGWVLVRPSGTEPIYRIFAESKNAEDAKKLIAEYTNLLKSYITS
jgi:phosphomannomutase/phosphoglucomutase